MIYRLGIEEIEPDHWLAWVFGLFGCYGRGHTKDEAIGNCPDCIRDYINWSEGYEQIDIPHESDIQVTVEEEFVCADSDSEYRINAFFEDDRKVLSEEDIYQIKWLANCTRRDLEAVVQPLDTEQLRRPIEGEVQVSIEGILRHIATAEWWYFDSLGLAFGREEIPPSIVDALLKVRSHSLVQLDQLADNETIESRRGELWSARKIVRRMLWHERVHTLQIEKYLRRG